jgi:hypothetical protein
MQTLRKELDVPKLLSICILLLLLHKGMQGRRESIVSAKEADCRNQRKKSDRMSEAPDMYCLNLLR